MEDKLRVNTRVVFVKDPTALPSDLRHHEAVEALAEANRLVILLSHGNKYHLPAGWLLPHNCHLIEYDLTVENIAENVIKIRNLLNTYGIALYSRFLDNSDPMPMLLAGACLTLSPGTTVAFINKPDQFNTTKQASIPYANTDWDLLD